MTPTLAFDVSFRGSARFTGEARVYAGNVILVITDRQDPAWRQEVVLNSRWFAALARAHAEAYGAPQAPDAPPGDKPALRIVALD